MRVSEKARLAVQAQAVSLMLSISIKGNEISCPLRTPETIGAHIAENEFFTISAVIGFLEASCD